MLERALHRAQPALGRHRRDHAADIIHRRVLEDAGRRAARIADDGTAGRIGCRGVFQVDVVELAAAVHEVHVRIVEAGDDAVADDRHAHGVRLRGIPRPHLRPRDHEVGRCARGARAGLHGDGGRHKNDRGGRQAL